MKLNARAGGITLGGVCGEGVVEDTFECAGGWVVGVDGQVAIDVEAEWSQIVKAKDVVGVAVGVEHCIDAPDAFPEGLCMEVGAGIDEDCALVVDEAD